MSETSKTQIFDRDALKRLLDAAKFLRNSEQVKVIDRLLGKVRTYKGALAQIHSDEEFFLEKYKAMRRDLVLIWKLYEGLINSMRCQAEIVQNYGTVEDNASVAEITAGIDALLRNVEGVEEVMNGLIVREGLDKILDVAGKAVGDLGNSIRDRAHDVARKVVTATRRAAKATKPS